MKTRLHEELLVPLRDVFLPGELLLPEKAGGIVVFAHGSGSSRHSARNRAVAHSLHRKGLGTLLFDLLTTAEDRDYQNRFNIDLLATRLAGATAWLERLPAAKECRIGFFGASTGAAAALKAAAVLPFIGAVVSRGGRPDLATGALALVTAPTLLIVGSRDTDVLLLNQAAYRELNCEKELALVEGATHLFEEPGTLQKVAELAGNWFEKYLLPVTASPAEMNP